MTNEKAGNKKGHTNKGTTRGALVRECLVFQLKLLADGFRDVLLFPVSLVATAVGLMRGGDHPEREFLQVIEVGRQSEQWINLFGQHEPIERAGSVGSIDQLLTRAETLVREQTQAGAISESAAKAVEKALALAHQEALAMKGGRSKDNGKGNQKGSDTNADDSSHDRGRDI